MRARIERSGKAQRGSAMILAVFVLAILTSMGVALLFMGQNSLKMSEVDVDNKRAFYLAEAGLEDGRASLLELHTASMALADHLDTLAGPNGVIDFDPDQISVTYNPDGSLLLLGGYGDDIPLRAPTVAGEGWYAAFLTNDPAELPDGETTLTDANDLLMITGIGSGRGNSLGIVQAIINPEPILPSYPPATILLLGPPPPDFDGGGTPGS